ncbi:MAG: class I SAM-dependent methyltransferase [archaeon]
MKDYYSVIAKGYNVLHEKEQLKKIFMIKSKLQPKGFILDIGCGTGISSKWKHCIGIDPSLGMLKHSKKNKICAKAEALPFKNKSFDTIISITALHHTDIDKVVKEIKRVAKPKAKLALTILKKSKKSKQSINKLKKSFKLKQYEENKDYILIGSIS